MSSTDPPIDCSNPPAQKSFSCVLCAQRKVKCDKQPRGCSNCSKARVPCIYKAPPPPRRRKKGNREIDAAARLKLYEEALRRLGIDPMKLEEEAVSALAPSGTLSGGLERDPNVPIQQFYGTSNNHLGAKGMLVQEGGKSRYLNNSMWTSIKEEFRDSTELFEGSSDEEETPGSLGSTPATLLTIWILTGIAGRIGQQLGLHKDPEALGLPPFDVEIKRRCWWQIVFLDGFAEKLAGAAGSVMIGDTEPPNNLNDSDLFPGMKEVPKAHEGATEMTFFLLRCQAGLMFNLRHAPGTFDGVWAHLGSTAVSLEVKYKAIDKLEAIMQDKFLRYCDTAVPWHFMCHFLAKAIVCIMRFTAHSPESYPNFGAHMPQADKDMLFDVCLRVSKYQIMLWHLNMHFQWKAFIYLISELRYRTAGSEVEDAWKQVQRVYQFHPALAKDSNRRGLPRAVGNITLKAWDAYTKARPMPEQEEPHFIHLLRSHHTKSEPRSVTTVSEQTPDISAPGYLDSVSYDPNMQPLDPFASFQWEDNFVAGLDPAFDLPDVKSLEPEQMNWSNWDNLVTNFQSQGAEGDLFTDLRKTPLSLIPKLVAHLTRSLANGEFSDYTITCNDAVFKVHKVIVCPQADFFANSVKFPSEVTSKSGKDAVDLPEDEPAIVKLMIQYLYEADYDHPYLPVTPTAVPVTPASVSTPGRKGSKNKKVSWLLAPPTMEFPHTCLGICNVAVCSHHQCIYSDWREPCCSNFICYICKPPTSLAPTFDEDASQLLINAKLYEIADKYQVTGLKDLVKTKFTLACQHFWNTPSFPVAAHHVFTSTPDEDKGLRDIICNTISTHMQLLNKPEIEAVMTECNGLAFGLLKQKSEAQGWC
ncbi:hypothetical protein P154DRAFT_552284 [Amniculicola lignicola CBS 123094]|uniref:Zn(2)-C6 fungal-type domain-containing protein n=1 Tax=Amniculicola lignicola CBS 123094 TaxID=1392246 RepID=A0A6A5WQN8_9PLEO|nr:hypothetical protein P154DRAFT_552284 [Amniculicola lignicola CBS 123094]